jgi:hypothetical protein
MKKIQLFDDPGKAGFSARFHPPVKGKLPHWLQTVLHFIAGVIVIGGWVLAALLFGGGF